MSAKVIDRYHPEMQQLCYQEVHAQTMRKKETIAFLTKYERTRVLAERTEELNANAPPYIDLSETPMLDNYHIAMKELENKLLPFIVRRVLPNGVSEYWDLNDLL
jgi:DNA-directed RNA polymerase I, II, and III subunit RPABC2